jgi:predicted 3-demethylubiquinone-9 3-methyltransferase (glyoxalase superfamily)
MEKTTQKITPFLWYDGKAEEAMKLYTSVFNNSKILNITRHENLSSGPTASVVVGTFQIEGQKFMAMDAGPMFKFSQAISFYVDCNTQEEVDELWEKLSEGGEKQQCGWLLDKFGVAWQIIPAILGEYMQDKDPKKVARVMQAMLKMSKINIKGLQEAYEKD